MGFWEAFGAGIAATLADANVVGLLSSFSGDTLELRWLAALVFAPLAVGVVGLGAWRASYAALARGEPPPNGLALGLGLGLGFLAGQQLSFAQALGVSTTPGTGVFGLRRGLAPGGR
jgi:hypothetical protein